MMTAGQKHELDVRDFWRVYEGLETYAKLDAKGAMERLRGHKEDGLCNVTDFSGNGQLMCTRDAYNAIIELAERHQGFLTVPDDYSLEELAAGVRKYIVKAIVDEKEEEAALARVLSEAVADADKNHISRMYHFPCVTVHYEEPPQFQIGAVVFTSAKAFPKVFEKALQAYVRSSKDENEEKRAKQRIQDFQNYLLRFGWLASVTVPPCAEEISKRRAEAAVTTAINLLRLVFGVDYGRDMRVAHIAFTQPSATEFAVTSNGEFNLVWSRKASGALVEKDWYAAMQKWQGFWALAAHFLATTLLGRRSEISYRVENALTWFGDSAFESAAGTQIVNFVAALERLTTTEAFSTHKFCSRVAILACEKDEDFEKSYWGAFEVHSARSAVIHGEFSPTSKAFQKKVRLAHDLTRNALFRGLAIQSRLDNGGKLSNLVDLQNFFTKQHSKWASVLKTLESELKRKKKAG
jgi:hypothetical protein